jgi:hypothetical protein
VQLQFVAAAKELRSIDGSAVALEQLDPDERVATRTAEDGLLRNGQGGAIRNNVHEHTRIRGMSALEIIAEKEPRFQA